MSTFRGDTGLIRKAMSLAGDIQFDQRTIFNDKYPKGGRRLKVWDAGVYFEDKKALAVLEKNIEKFFGKRLVSQGLFLSLVWNPRAGLRSYVVYLKD